MEELKSRFKAMKQALYTLQEGLDEMQIPVPGRPKAYKLMRDGVTQRFEYCIDSFWKFLKFYLEVVSKVSVESPSPKVVFKQVFQLMLVSDEPYAVLLKCTTDRNLTSHTYNEKTAEEIYEHIPLYHVTMKAVVDRLEIIT